MKFLNIWCYEDTIVHKNYNYILTNFGGYEEKFGGFEITLASVNANNLF